MRPEKSGNQEFFFVVDPNRTILKKPLYFHHIPKTGGTSIRFAARAWLWERDAGEIIAPHFERDLRAGGRFPDGVVAFFHAAQSLARIEAVMGHYTARLANVVSDPILAMVREPTQQLASNLAFRPNRIEALGDGILEHPRINNIQMRSLTDADIPPYQPPETELKRWYDLVDEAVARFSLFADDQRPALLKRLETDYGMTIADEGRHKPRPEKESVVAAVDRLMDMAAQKDPMWLDRILYRRVREIAASEAVEQGERAPTGAPASAGDR